MKISVIGCGYLGAVHAASMAELGHDVTGIDVDQARVASLSSGVAPFHEPGFDDLLVKNFQRLNFTTDMSHAANASVHFIAVGTPQSSDGSADMTYVNQAIDALIPHLSPGDLVVGKSTVPVGTAERLSALITPSGAILMWNPEFLREGFAVEDTLSPDRLVYGLPEGDTADSAQEILDQVYETILATGTPRLIMNFATAELVKVAANSFLATKISFINAMAEISEVTGANVTQLADAIGHDNRIGRRFLNAGIGFGGGCLPKDIRGFVARADELGLGSSLDFLKNIDEINLRRRGRVLDVATDELGELAGKRIAVWGLAFKPDSDDIRDSPALDIVESLARAGAHVVAADPQASIPAAKRIDAAGLSGQVSVSDDYLGAAAGVDAIVVATEWKAFQEVDPKAMASVVANKLVIDGRNCLDADAWKAAGFTYRGMGRS
ncbi:UDP-glucose/GDP-mannose dehydrogenase family protein [Pontimonas sp.]|nr:UDP-glucose/GDP-mannose dehydrogenase family protein [Pontimonas sp.]MDA9116801.1 UDP-glucose/GDP-mannose dehydrogenase family protein [Pontimonas sp.]